MRRSSAASGLGTVTLLLLLAASGATETRRPNVIFFLIDDLGWRDLGCYGSPFYETPHIDRFAEQGVRFTQAYATCHVCSPTRASIMTGKYPARLQLTDWLPGRCEFPFQQLKNAEIHQHLHESFLLPTQWHQSLCFCAHHG